MGPLSKLKDSTKPTGLRILLITPLKALSRDLKNAVYLAAQFLIKTYLLESEMVIQAHMKKRSKYLNLQIF